MKSLSKLSIILCILLIGACSSKKGNFVTEHESAWMDGLERGLMYCRANKVEGEILANPICFEARFEEYKDEKKREDKRKRKERRD